MKAVLRDPNTVMRLSRLGSFHQCRLSFMRVFLRRIAQEDWRFERAEFEIDERCVGHAVYTLHGPERSYSLIAFAHDLPAEKRSDRVIAEAWDATFTLFDGIPDASDIERLSKNVPLQEAGRISEKELSLSRANRSVRLWEHVIDSLASGRQPDDDKIDAVGYLMRTTAVYGSGKFGAADREKIKDRSELSAPFQAEMLSVYLIRTFVRDLVEHAAMCRAPGVAVPLDKALARRIGIGNSTGLGMAPFLLNHPVLLNNWIMAREMALTRVRTLSSASESEVEQFLQLFHRAVSSVEIWQSAHPIQVQKLVDLNADIKEIKRHLETSDWKERNPWDRLAKWSANALSIEGQEFLISLMLEPYGELVDELADEMSASEDNCRAIDGSVSIAEIRGQLSDVYGWALDTDWSKKENVARAWYVSEEKLEPRLGERFEEPIAEFEQPLAPGRDAAALSQSLKGWQDGARIAEFLLNHPEHRHTVRRLQTVASVPFAEIKDNTIGNEVLPIDMLRCKLSFFGAIHFDPRSDRWVRICMFGNAPYPEEISQANADFWVYPENSMRSL